MKLALRQMPASELWTDRFANWAVKVRLVTQYPHAGIVIGDKLYHATASKGLHVSEYTPEHWTLIDIGGDDMAALHQFAEWDGASYDWFSLLAFVGLKVRDSSRMYCYEWCHLVMTGAAPKGRVTPETLLTLACQPR